jgi:hypothetical protein
MAAKRKKVTKIHTISRQLDVESAEGLVTFL